MSFIKQYVLIFSVCVLLVILLTGCAEFQTKLDMMKSEQMNCKPPEASLCAGWKI